MEDKNITKIIYGTVAIIVIVVVVFMLKNKKEENGGEWETYRNNELNIETKLPEGVEVEIKK